METRYLKSLIAVVDSGSIADAARTEHLTAAAIGQRVQALERELGFPLLSRSGHAARPTEACLALLPRARRIVREATLLGADMSADGLGGTLRIGAISTALTGLLLRALRELTRAAPRCRPVIVPGTSLGLFHLLQEGGLDAAVIVSPPFKLPATLRAVTLRREPLTLLTPQGLKGRPATLLRAHPYIRYDPRAWGGRHAAGWLRAQGIEPTVLCDLDALETIAMLVGDGLGVALVPAWAGIERFTQACRTTRIAGAPHERSVVLVSSLEPDLPQLTALLARTLARSGPQGPDSFTTRPAAA